MDVFHDKVGLSQLTKSLNEELQLASKNGQKSTEPGSFTADGLSNIAAHQLSPGLVLTDLLLRDASPVSMRSRMRCISASCSAKGLLVILWIDVVQVAKRFFNVLAEEPDTVARELAPRIRLVASRNESVEFLSFTDALYRVYSGRSMKDNTNNLNEQNQPLAVTD